MKTIGGIFGRSAYGPLHEHVLKVQNCLQLLKPMVSSFLNRQWEEVNGQAEEMHRREAEADRIKNGIRRSLSHSFLHSVERAEMLFTLKVQDDVSDGCEAVAELLQMRQTPVPDAVQPQIVAACEQVVTTGEELVQIVAQLPELEKNSYPREGMHKLTDMLDKLHHEEHLSNQAEHDALREVFRNEGQVDPVSVVFLMKIIQRLGDIADAAENTADCIERMVGRR